MYVFLNIYIYIHLYIYIYICIWDVFVYIYIFTYVYSFQFGLVNGLYQPRKLSYPTESTDVSCRVYSVQLRPCVSDRDDPSGPVTAQSQ